MEIHGKEFFYDNREHGLYLPNGAREDYAVMDVRDLLNKVNALSRKDAIKAVSALKDKALEQSAWTQAPQNIGFPILIQRPSPAPIDEVRENIQNTVKFTSELLKILEL